MSRKSTARCVEGHERCRNHAATWHPASLYTDDGRAARGRSPYVFAARSAHVRTGEEPKPHPPASLPGEPERDESRLRLEEALVEIKRVIAGQDEMLERVLVCLVAGGHLLIEGVPGLAKTLTIKTTAAVLGGTFRRVQFTPDLVPSDLVGTRVFRPDHGGFETELGPVFCNFLLADEINRAPAKVQSALLEVMQERQVTIGHDTHPVPDPFLVMATQNPIESEGTYPLPEAQVDRFMLKVLVDYPQRDEELTVVHRALEDPVDVRQMPALDELRTLQRAVRTSTSTLARQLCGQAGGGDARARRVRARRPGGARRVRRQPARPDRARLRRPRARRSSTAATTSSPPTSARSSRTRSATGSC